ncbi:MAG TPA: efflux RND transporter periplasmic adaptor subunit [Bacillota bacterium]|nr:efflux RND transporter periplasmic adaptor subunit [Clostridiaceae bacterium]HNR05050.1 efflux RND transporter periplasmic adaptor subunit [Bacillota bacterium]HNT02513.1 efflux RND transporter periplasmic adaptor subunit [Bacillota bacterium]HNU80072.1 efflux RND transporter periplasmic adaptor subunit [Bacillota bacterium]HPA55470.1 efflux RND transporter periplasmic adaptor subunit [Bacillota bacterium]
MKRKYTKLIIGIVVVTLLGSLIFTYVKNKAGSSANINADTVVAVSVEAAAKTSVSATVNLNGKLKPIQEINIIPKLPGKVNNIYFDIGQSVKAGDVLFTLEDNDIRSQLKQAQAGLDMANSGLAKVTGGGAELQELQLKAALTSAEISYNDAKLAFERTKQLYESGAVSKATLEQSESQFKLMEQQYNSAKSNYEITTTKTNPENIASAKAQVSQAAAALELAKSQLDNTVIKSPINGVIAARVIEIGELAGSTGIAMSVIDLSSVLIDINATEGMINKIQVGDKAEVTIKSVGDSKFTGEIINISPTIDTRTQSYPVRIKIDNSSGTLKGGMFAEVKTVLDKVSDVIAVPISSVIEEGDKRFVYVLNGDIAEKREVSTGLFDDELIVIVKGLAENDAVIVKGQELIIDGSKVIVTEN